MPKFSRDCEHFREFVSRRGMPDITGQQTPVPGFRCGLGHFDTREYSAMSARLDHCKDCPDYKRAEEKGSNIQVP